MQCKMMKYKDKYKYDVIYFLNNASEWKHTNTSIYIILFQYRWTNKSIAQATCSHGQYVDSLRRITQLQIICLHIEGPADLDSLAWLLTGW